MKYTVEPMRTLAAGAAVVLVVGAGSLWMAADGSRADRRNDAETSALPPRPASATLKRETPITQLMTPLGQGEDSLTSMIGRALKESQPDWADLDRQSREYADLAKQLASMKPPRGSSDSWKKSCEGFHSSAEELVRAVEAGDRAATLAAHAKLARSCVSCHREHRILAAPNRKPEFDGDEGIRNGVVSARAVVASSI